MPPENTDPVAKTQSTELDFEAPAVENPRIKKRSLKGRSTTTQPQSASATTETPRAAATPDQPRSSLQTPSPATGYVRPGTAPTAEKSQQANPSGVLYYTNGPQKDAAPKSASATTPAARPAPASTQTTSQRPATTPMQTSPTSRPASPLQNPTRPVGSSTASSHSTQQAPTSRPAASAPSSTGTARAVSTTVASPASSSRPGGVSDYRANIDRQSREQKSIGGIINLIVYALIAIFVLGAGLAAYGAHVIFKQLNAQSMTVSELDSRYSAANDQLNAQLKNTAQAVLQLQEQVNRDQDLALKQQDMISKMQAELSADTEALRQERAARSTETSIRISETAALRTRLRALETRDQSNYHP